MMYWMILWDAINETWKTPEEMNLIEQEKVESNGTDHTNIDWT